jgi:hypothetical protein
MREFFSRGRRGALALRRGMLPFNLKERFYSTEKGFKPSEGDESKKPKALIPYDGGLSELLAMLRSGAGKLLYGGFTDAQLDKKQKEHIMAIVRGEYHKIKDECKGELDGFAKSEFEQIKTQLAELFNSFDNDVAKFLETQTVSTSAQAKNSLDKLKSEMLAKANEASEEIQRSFSIELEKKRIGIFMSASDDLESRSARVLRESDGKLSEVVEQYRSKFRRDLQAELNKNLEFLEETLKTKLQEVVQSFKNKTDSELKVMIGDAKSSFLDALQQLHMERLNKSRLDLIDEVENAKRAFSDIVKKLATQYRESLGTLARDLENNLKKILEDKRETVEKAIEEKADSEVKNLESHSQKIKETIDMHSETKIIETRQALEKLKAETVTGTKTDLDEKAKATKGEIEELSRNSKSWFRYRVFIYTLASNAALALLFLVALYLFDQLSKTKYTKEEIFDLLQEFDDFESRLDEGDIKIKQLTKDLIEDKFLKLLPLIMKMRLLPLILLYSYSMTEENGHLCVGGVLLLRSEYDLALQVFDHVLESNQKSPDAYYGKAYALNKLGKRKEALECIDDGNKTLDPNEVKVTFRLLLLKADILSVEGKLGEATKNYEDVIERNAEKVRAGKVTKRNTLYLLNSLKSRAYILCDQEKFDDALQVFKKAKKILDIMVQNKFLSEEPEKHPLYKEIELGLALSEFKQLDVAPGNEADKHDLKKKVEAFWRDKRFMTIESKLRRASRLMGINQARIDRSPSQKISTDYEYALMVKNTQANRVILDKDEDPRLVMEGWKLSVSSDLDFGDTKKTFKVNVYSHEERHQVVVVFQDDSNFLEKFIDLLKSSKDRQQVKALEVVESQIKPNTSITLSGFGYGAVIAEVILHEVCNSKRNDHPGLDIESVTFNSAGAEPYIKRPDLPSHVRAVTYLTAPDLTNTHGKQIATAIQLRSSYNYKENSSLFDGVIYPIGRTSRETYRFTIAEVIESFPHDDYHRDDSRLILVKRWPVGSAQLRDYTDIERKFAFFSGVVVDDNRVKLSGDDSQKLNACYKTQPFGQKTGALSEFSDDMCLYLRAYVYTNGKSDEDVNHGYMKFTIKNNNIIIHSDISLLEFKRYIGHRIVMLGKEGIERLGLYKKLSASTGFFADKYQFFSSKNYMFKDMGYTAGLSTVGNRM